jgi:adenosylhomocysteine nucleosidase
MKRIAIVAALPGELKPLVRGWQQRERNLWLGRLGEYEALAIAGGMGAAAAGRAAERLIEESRPEALLSYGWVGALTCAVKPGAACVISEIVDASTEERFQTKNSDGFRLITLDRVARADEKRGLAQKHQAVLVDMEAAAVARVAAARGVDFYCFKGVSDGYTDQLPDFNRFIDSQGRLRVAALLAHAAVRPKFWPSILRLGKNSGTAAAAIAATAKECLGQRS